MLLSIRIGSRSSRWVEVLEFICHCLPACFSRGVLELQPPLCPALAFSHPWPGQADGLANTNKLSTWAWCHCYGFR